MCANSRRDAVLREVEEDLLGAVDELVGLAGPLPAEPRDLLPRADEPAQRRHLADDPRVVRGVRGRRDERGELVDADPPAHVLELASLLELVDERDRVDGLAPGVQRERRAVDLRVALAVEVARVEDLADRPDRAGGEHHRPEDRLLGLEVLRRNRGGLRELGDLGHRTPSQPLSLEALVASGQRCFRHGEPLRCAGKRTAMLPAAPDGAVERQIRSEREVRARIHRHVRACGRVVARCDAGLGVGRVGRLGLGRSSAAGSALVGRGSSSAGGVSSSTASASATSSSASACCASAAAAAASSSARSAASIAASSSSGGSSPPSGTTSVLHLDVARPGRARSAPCSGRSA